MNQRLHYQEILQLISAYEGQYGWSLQPPISDANLQRLVRDCRIKLGSDLPEGCIHFLNLHDGLGWNGLMVYASDRTPFVNHPDEFIMGFIDANVSSREADSAMTNFLLFGEDEVYYYAVDLSTQAYVQMDQQRSYILTSVGSFEELMAIALSRAYEALDLSTN